MGPSLHAEVMHCPKPSDVVTHRLGGMHMNISSAGGVDATGTQRADSPKGPLVQIPDEQATPHVPQWFGSVRGFEQTPSQQRPSINVPSSRLPKRQATPDTPAAHWETTQSPAALATVPG